MAIGTDGNDYGRELDALKILLRNLLGIVCADF
jgi:hypothetical protein